MDSVHHGNDFYLGRILLKQSSCNVHVGLCRIRNRLFNSSTDIGEVRFTPKYCFTAADAKDLRAGRTETLIQAQFLYRSIPGKATVVYIFPHWIDSFQTVCFPKIRRSG
ncbi:hypothetical protein JTB14_019513 [Gonioctena quinquepunctata]|nr:hypothetical protein JTB14_019513 [Gonioctena quinquepunctata]